MVSSNRRFKAGSNIGGDLYDSTQSEEHVGTFGQYLLHGSEPKEHLYNPENLFDDSNSQNIEWLKKTKAYLARRTKR